MGKQQIGLRIIDKPYIDEPATIHENVVFDLDFTHYNSTRALLLDADDPKKVIAEIVRPRIRISSRGVFVIGSEPLGSKREIRDHALKLPIEVKTNVL